MAEIALAAGGDRQLDAFASRLQDELRDRDGLEGRARRLVERLALAVQGSLLVRYGDPRVAGAFCASRLGGDWGHAFGTLPSGADVTALAAHATPEPA
jgi:putative acyl-CoA dehydrogenase